MSSSHEQVRLEAIEAAQASLRKEIEASEHMIRSSERVLARHRRRPEPGQHRQGG